MQRFLQLLAWSVHPDELTAEITGLLNGIMNAPGLAPKVRVGRADDDTCVLSALLVQSNEIAAIDGDDRTFFGGSQDQHLRVGHTLTRTLPFQD